MSRVPPPRPVLRARCSFDVYGSDLDDLREAARNRLHQLTGDPPGTWPFTLCNVTPAAESAAGVVRLWRAAVDAEIR